MYWPFMRKISHWKNFSFYCGLRLLIMIPVYLLVALEIFNGFIFGKNEGLYAIERFPFMLVSFCVGN